MTAVSTLPLVNLRRDGGTQVRAKMNTETVDAYAEALAEGVTFPPVVVFFDGKDHWLADGFHRVLAHEKAGLADILADVRDGSKRDALLFAVGANATHGLARTNKDKRRAVEILLRDEEWAGKSDRQIAEKVCVSNKFVGDIRREQAGVNGTHLPDERTGKDGKQYPTRKAKAPANDAAVEDKDSVEAEALDRAASLLDVPRSTVEAAARVLKNGVPELVEAIERGHVDVWAADRMATLPAEEQREALRAAKAKPAAHPVLAEIEQAADLAALDRAFNKVATADLSEADATTAGDIYRRKAMGFRKQAGEVNESALVKQLTDAVEAMTYERNESVMDAIIAAHASKAITQDQWAALDKAWWTKFNAIRHEMAAAEPEKIGTRAVETHAPAPAPAPPRQADLFSQPPAPTPPPAADTVTVNRAEWEAMKAEVEAYRAWVRVVDQRTYALAPTIKGEANLERIRRLIETSGSPNENEARNAAVIACRMIRDQGVKLLTSDPSILDDIYGVNRRILDIAKEMGVTL